MQEKDALIGIFDEKGNVVGNKTRAEVNKKTDILKNVIIMVVNSNKEIFVVRPINSVFDGLWGSAAAGLVRLNEVPKEAALRTIDRELGLTEELNHLMDDFYNFNGIKRFSSVFYFEKDNLEINKNEVVEAKLVTPDFVEKNAHQFMPTFKAAFEEMKRLGIFQ